MFTNQSAAVSARRTRSTRLRRLVAGAITVPLAVLGLVTTSAPAAQALAGPAPVAQVLPSGFPAWYEDNNGNRAEACLDANDANCVLPPANTEPDWNPAQPLSFPTNFPSEFFYSLATSDNVATPGCGASAPGRAFVTLAVEGAFINGAPAAGDQMVFGRIRVRATSGLCAGKAYTFRHPFGSITLTANAAGAIPVNTPGATTDIGCLTPSALAPCDFTLATGSTVFGATTTGFLKWDPAVAPAAPVGYLGDPAVLHPIVGASGPGSLNGFEVSGDNGAGGVWTGSTDQFTVAGKTPGSLVSTPVSVDFAGVTTSATSATRRVTVTNLDKAVVSLGGNAVRLNRDAGVGDFGIVATTCSNRTLSRDETCTVDVNVKPSALGPRTDTLQVAYTNGIRSPLSIPLRVTGTTAGNQPNVGVAPSPLAFGDVRIRTTLSKNLTVTNTGTAPLQVSSVTLTDGIGLGTDASQFRIGSTTCVGTTVAVGGTCTVTVIAVPSVRGANSASVVIASNIAGSPTNVPVTSNGTGGVAAVATDKLAIDQFPTWYRDENGVKVSQCIDASDPYCIVLPDATYTGGAVSWLPDGPLNFPGEFFYTVADSDQLATPGCNGTAPGRSAYRSAVEGTFVNGDPVNGEQMVFGRERLFVTSGLCPNTNYTFTTPYGQSVIRTNSKGGVARNAGTVDVGCAPVAPAVCNFEDALSSPVAGGFLRWDPAVAPAAPAGYIGDAVSLHRVVGAPFKENGVDPSNYFKITGPGLPTAGLQTNQFSVMGKLQGPLEAAPADLTGGKLVAPSSPVGTGVTATVNLTNTGVAVGASTGNITLNGFTVGGVDAAEFAVTGGTCVVGTALAPGDSCSVVVTFTPADLGVRAATLSVAHTGLNNPFVLPLEGVGEAATGKPAISFTPRSLAFGQLAVGRTSKVETVTVSNAGGTADLVVGAFNLPSDYTLVTNGCTVAVVPGGTCSASFLFSPTTAGSKNGSITVSDNVGGGTHTIPLTGAGFGGAKAVSGTLGRFGYPNYYQDANGTRLEPCLDTQNCVLLGVPDPAAPLSVPDNFPNEFFYALADTEQVTIPDTGCGTGTAFLRVGLEGSFANGTPVAGDQTTFTRIRLVVRGGLCPNVANYTAVTPYGTFTFGTDGVGAVKPNAGTQDTGCGAAAVCNFADALTSPGALLANVATPIEGFLRWDPNIGTAAPAGYLGDATSFHKVTGGTYVKPDGVGAFNGFEIVDPATNVLASTDNWLVAGKVAGPLNTDTFTVDLGALDQGQTSPSQPVVVTNVGAAATTVTPSIAGPNANQFTVTGGTCGASVNPDATCTVTVAFKPTLGGAGGAKNASLVLTPTSGPTATVALTGVANEVLLPSISVTPGVLSYGTVNAGASTTQSFTISNPGATALHVAAMTVNQLPTDYSITGGTCGAAPITVAVGGSCTVRVSFSPTATGARTGSVTLTHDAPGTSTVVSLTGSGAAATITPSSTSVNFGTVTRNSTKSTTVSVRNSGTINATLSSVTVAGSGTFTIAASSTCRAGTVLAAGKSCTVVINFRPTAVGTVNATVTIDGGATALPRTSTIALTGTGR